MAQEFGSGVPQRSTAADSRRPSTVHVLSQLLRLRQCCCHLSLLKSALDPKELESEGLVLSLEEQLSALTLSKVDVSEPSPTVSLNGTCFKVELFDDTRRSTKVLLSPLCLTTDGITFLPVLDSSLCTRKELMRGDVEGQSLDSPSSLKASLCHREP